MKFIRLVLLSRYLKLTVLCILNFPLTLLYSVHSVSRTRCGVLFSFIFCNFSNNVRFYPIPCTIYDRSSANANFPNIIELNQMFVLLPFLFYCFFYSFLVFSKRMSNKVGYSSLSLSNFRRNSKTICNVPTKFNSWDSDRKCL